MLDTFRFKNDTALRRKLMTPESFAHPAKMAIGLLQEIAARYDIKPGDWVLDPMSGSGTTAMLALQGINCLLVELEPHFVAPMRASWEKMRQHPMLGCELGEVLIIRGDARHLPIASADHIVTSPPWENTVGGDASHLGTVAFNPDGSNRLSAANAQGYTRPSAIITSPPYESMASGEGPGAAGPNSGMWTGAIGGYRSSAKGYTRPSAIITSPPYEGSVSDNKEGPGQTSVPGGWKADAVNKHGGYTRPVNAIISSPPYGGSLQGEEPKGKLFETERRVNSPASGNRKSLRKPLGQGYTRPVDAEEGGAATTQLKCTCGVAAVITSPSYEGTNIGRSESMGEAPFGGPHSQARGAQYANGNAENIGNMRGQAYWGENGMTAVYRECFRCLRPGGLMVLVLKGFVRAGVYQDLPAETQSLCESLGFVKFDEWRRELWSLSFWRILQKRRDPAAFDERLNYETVLAFRKTAMTV